MSSLLRRPSKAFFTSINMLFIFRIPICFFVMCSLSLPKPSICFMWWHLPFPYNGLPYYSELMWISSVIVPIIVLFLSLVLLTALSFDSELFFLLLFSYGFYWTPVISVEQETLKHIVFMPRNGHTSSFDRSFAYGMQ